MEYRPLGFTNIKVSGICLGTMTWGEQNSEMEAHAQIEMSLEHGVNFIDAAEMYPVPPRAETQGATESILGNWLQKNKATRAKLIIASKVTGRSQNFSYLRGGEIRLDSKNIIAALEGSLKRLKTDYIDLYQLHWPDRSTNYFGELGYTHHQTGFIPLAESLAVMNGLIKQGKIRYAGLSNETPWGVLDALRASEQHNLPRVVSIQNPYNLLNRSFEVGLAEIAIREKVGLLAYSPLAFGVLSGKYLGGALPIGARLTRFERFQRYRGEKAHKATQRYVSVAGKYGLNPAQMALAFIHCQPFVTSTIIGATTLRQLEENISSIRLTLHSDVLKEIETIQQDIPNPCP